MRRAKLAVLPLVALWHVRPRSPHISAGSASQKQTTKHYDTGRCTVAIYGEPRPFSKPHETLTSLEFVNLTNWAQTVVLCSVVALHSRQQLRCSDTVLSCSTPVFEIKADILSIANPRNDWRKSSSGGSAILTLIYGLTLIILNYSAQCCTRGNYFVFTPCSSQIYLLYRVIDGCSCSINTELFV